MANFDIRNQTAPANKLKRPSYPRIEDLRAALKTVNGGNSYPDHRLNSMSLNDMIHAASLHDLEVNGLTPITPPDPEPNP